MDTYLREFTDRDDAVAWMTQKNRACHRAGNTTDLYAVVDGPTDNFAVVDLDTAIDLGLGYEWRTQ